MNTLLSNILNDICVDLVDEFDNNFSKGGFFGKRWTARVDGTPSHLIHRGALRSSKRGRVQGSSVVFTSNMPYAGIHNTGGEITVTAKMRGWWWYEFKRTKDKKYKAMALKYSVGDKMKIPKRQYIGDHPRIRANIEEIVSKCLKENLNDLANNINKR